ncbi:MAG: diadenylate cyclase CdaA [Candidatus Omnitrophica bacterium]|nr:diadenylate cyclase CdaA [Candidatus Omnitrophota bacterium]
MELTQLIAIWKPIVEILILWFVIYHILLFLEGTRAVQVLLGIIILVVAFFVFQRLDLKVLDWLLTKVFGISVIAVLILFHPEIRQGLARLGRRHLFTAALKEEHLDRILNEIIKAAEGLCRDKAGALIAIEKQDMLNQYVASGVHIDSEVSAELIQTIFTPRSILHDGGLIIQHGRVMAAGCIFPLSDNQDLSRIFGTRHRAALGLSEESDAIIFVVSEERQDVSLVYRGNFYRGLERMEILNKTKEFLKVKKEEEQLT